MRVERHHNFGLFVAVQKKMSDTTFSSKLLILSPHLQTSSGILQLTATGRHAPLRLASS